MTYGMDLFCSVGGHMLGHHQKSIGFWKNVEWEARFARRGDCWVVVALGDWTVEDDCVGLVISANNQVYGLGR